MKQTELESKLEISDKDFQRLKSVSLVKSYLDHLNIYYDHNNLLSGSAVTFRIRLSRNSTPKMTLKIPVQHVQGRREALEIESSVEANGVKLRAKNFDVERDLPTEFRERFIELGVQHLERMGWMRTHRWLVQLPDGPEIELDQVYLPNGEIFYEAEIEGDDQQEHQKAVEIIFKHAASARPSSYSKYERFTKALSDLLHRKSAGHEANVFVTSDSPEFRASDSL